MEGVERMAWFPKQVVYLGRLWAQDNGLQVMMRPWMLKRVPQP